MQNSSLGLASQKPTYVLYISDATRGKTILNGHIFNALFSEAGQRLHLSIFLNFQFKFLKDLLYSQVFPATTALQVCADKSEHPEQGSSHRQGSRAHSLGLPHPLGAKVSWRTPSFPLFLQAAQSDAARRWNLQPHSPVHRQALLAGAARLRCSGPALPDCRWRP